MSNIIPWAQLFPGEEPPSCPRCGSSRLVLVRPAFGMGKAIVGGALLGPIGALFGLAGSGKIICRCLSCGYKKKLGKL